jgi:hypothetical protein
MRAPADLASLAWLVFHLVVARSTTVQMPGPQTEGWRCGTSAVTCTQLLPESCSNAGQSAQAWPRVRIPDPHVALMVRRALDEAWRLLGESRCQLLLEEFRDGNGRPLSERLRRLGLDVQRYLGFVVFEDGQQYLQCGDTFAYTQPGSRIVYLCVRSIESEWRQNRWVLAVNLIHEVLHTLGLEENPPSSAEITERVRTHCGDAR